MFGFIIFFVWIIIGATTVMTAKLDGRVPVLSYIICWIALLVDLAFRFFLKG